jgi:hypothetical protein
MTSALSGVMVGMWTVVAHVCTDLELVLQQASLSQPIGLCSAHAGAICNWYKMIALLFSKCAAIYMPAKPLTWYMNKQPMGAFSPVSLSE